MIHHEIKWLQQTIQKQFPHWNIDSFQTLGEGWMSKTFLVNEEWVFRFAKHQEASVDLGKEIRILPDLAAHLTLAIPQFEFTGRQANGLMYVVYKKSSRNPIESNQVADPHSSRSRKYGQGAGRLFR